MAKRIVRRPERVHHVVSYSGGKGSWATAMRVRERYGTDNLKLLFADTLIEDQDLYRFLIETAAVVYDLPRPDELIEHALAIPDLSEDEDAMAYRRRELVRLAMDAREAIPGLKWIQEGRDPWEVFYDRRFLGNARLDPCSEELKRKFLRNWLERHYSPSDTTSYIGIDWTEEHRLKKARPHWMPWTVEAPLCEPPLKAKAAVTEELDRLGIAQPRLYEEGFPHNNCGGFCVKAGMAHFKLLLQKRPEVYLFHERREQDIREFLDKDVAILRDRSKAAMEQNDGKAKPLPLVEFRERVMANGEIDENEWGGCGCAL